jgi:putative membrane protein insertion efficiency factor
MHRDDFAIVDFTDGDQSEEDCGHMFFERKKIFLCLIIALLMIQPVFADEVAGLGFIMRHNVITLDIPDKHAHSASFDFFAAETNEVKLFFLFVLKFYQIVIYSQDRPSCMFTPTCSEYTLLAIRKYGFIAGTVMGAARLLRCNGTGHKFYTVDEETGRLYDPFE